VYGTHLAVAVEVELRGDARRLRVAAEQGEDDTVGGDEVAVVVTLHVIPVWCRVPDGSLERLLEHLLEFLRRDHAVAVLVEHLGQLVAHGALGGIDLRLQLLHHGLHRW
jgi:hypothetical protein